MKKKLFRMVFIVLIALMMNCTAVFVFAGHGEDGVPENNAPKAKVVFDSPSAEGIWTGTREIAFHLENVDTNTIRSVEVYLDGRLIKDFAGPPYTFRHTFGTGGKNHRLKVLVLDKKYNALVRGDLHSFHADDAQDVRVELVMVPVVVTDKSGAYVRGLKQEDFTLYSDGEAVPITFFNAEGEAQFNMAQLIDISFSMRNKIHHVIEASKGFLKKLITNEDRGTFVFFNHRVFDHTGFSGDYSELVEKLNLQSPVIGGTALYDSIAYTLNLLDKKRGWNIMIIFSDGDDNSSYIDEHSLMLKAKKSSVVIYAIDNGRNRGSGVLPRLCSLSGGMLFPLDDVKGTDKVYERIRRDIRSRYILFFDANAVNKGKDRGRFRRLSVTVKKTNCNIRTLRGYY